MKNGFYNNLEKELEMLKQSGIYKELRYLQSPLSSKVSLENLGEVIVLCSNNYLGLADNPQVVEAGINALKKYGAGAASVRFICGTYDIHRELEDKVAKFLGKESALTYTSCWAANTAVIPALLKAGDAVISDELNHASIIDGCRLLGRDVKRLIYKHAEMNSLEEKLKEAGEAGTKLIVTDGVFSMEGDVAPLKDIVELAGKYGALVMVDDSHATGVIGKTGRGTEEYHDIMGKVDIITGTFGKALGGAGGGFITGRKSIIDICIQRSRPHLFSNSLPPVLAAIAIAALEYLESNPGIVESLREKTRYFRDKLKKAGLNPLEGDSAIIPIIIGDTAKAIKVAGDMLKKGVYAIGFGYPVVPEGTARIRIQVSDALSYPDIDYSINIIKESIEKHI
ncbi:MAG: glycine C-acetyltransferase [Clostridiaceae bacterium]|nr:glycine C-acetyltransferase [Clostridiaceae bacterium]